MKLNSKPQFFARSCTFFMSVLMAVALTACGGGNGSAGAPISGPGGGTGTGGSSGSGGSGTAVNGAIALALTTSAGTAATMIPAGGALNATVHVTDAKGKPVPDVVVTYTVSSPVGVLPVTTALTDSTGAATVSLQSGTQGAATITATTTIPATAAVATPAAITATATFQSPATGPAAAPTIALALVPDSGCASNIVTAACPLTATATVQDATGNPVANTIVTFANTLSYTVLSPSSGTVLTNNNGVATVTVTTTGLPSNAADGSAGTVNVGTTISGVTVSAAQNYTLGNTAISLVMNSPASVNVTSYGSTTIAVQVDSNGSIYQAQPVTVSFTSGCAAAGTAKLAASATTVNGIARVTYTDNGCGQPDKVTASLTGAQSVSAVLNVAPPVASSINFVSATPSDSSIVLPSTGGTTRTSQAVLVFQVVDTQGKPLSLQNVTFSNNNPAAATLNSTSGVTDSSGNVSATVTAANTGTFAITAALTATPAINAISNNVIVSTGTPVQASFTLAATTFNIEGWNVAGVTSTLTAYIADALGDKVVNGTPVVATTNEGSIGNISGVSAGCTTTDGQCSLQFLSQLPRTYTDPKTGVTTYGIATVSFSSTNDTTVPITGQIQIYLSGDYPYLYAFEGGAWTQVNGSGTGVITSTNCSPNIDFVLADLNGNPMPAKTQILVQTTQPGIAFGTVFPAAISNYGVGAGVVFPYATPNLVVNGQSVVVPLTINQPAAPCDATGKNTAQINFTVETTSPLGTAYQLGLVYQYPTL